MWSTVTGKIIGTQSNEVGEDREEGQSPKIKSRVSNLLGRMKNKVVHDIEKKAYDIDPELAARTLEIKKEFELYQANSKDQTYMSDWNNFEDRSISLIISGTNKHTTKSSKSII